ncbi:MAG: ABC transporter ATP-binding protein [Pseudomonadota bacterium]
MLLELNAVEKSFPVAEGRQHVLKGVSMAIDAGETLALTGESGSGKSTLLHIAAGLESADAGRVSVDGLELSTLDDAQRANLRKGTIGIVFQQFNLIPSLTVSANIAFQARLAGKTNTPQTTELAERLGLSDHLNKYPEALSGGQQQRVAIARTLAARPKIVLADEPTGNLDEATAALVLTSMLDLVGETGATLIVATHSMRTAERLDRRVHLSGGVLA